VKGLTTNDNVDNRIPSTYYDHDNDNDDDIEQPALQSKRISSIKKIKRQNVSTPLMASSKRKGDPQGGDSSLEVDIKRIKAEPDAGSGGGGGGADDNGDLFEGGADGEDYEGLGQFDDDGADFDDSVGGGSGAGTSGGDNKGRQKQKKNRFWSWHRTWRSSSK
jgi:hypothetical protein